VLLTILFVQSSDTNGERKNGRNPTPQERKIRSFMGPSDVMWWFVGKILKFSTKIQSGVSDSRKQQMGKALLQNLVEEGKWWGERKRKMG